MSGTRRYPRLISAFAKSERARVLIEEFLARANDFRKSASNAGPYMNAFDSMPQDLSCMVGDALHNLRSALDHVAFTFAEPIMPSQISRKINFLIREAKADFERDLATDPIAQRDDGWRAFLEETEPYAGGRGERLSRLAVLNNVDKHRQILKFDASLRSWSAELSGPATETRVPLRGLNLREALNGPPDFEGIKASSIDFLFTDAAATADPRDAYPVLQEIAADVDDVLRRARGLF